MRPVLLLFVVVLAACAGSADPADIHTPADENATHGAGKPSDPSDAPPAPSASTAQSDRTGPSFACGLPAPVSSEDACSNDADCAPATPCHARACVASSKAVARKPDTVCSMNIDCRSADVNPCSCYEGRCALVPKSP